jgi:hypothetical protein
MRGGGIRGGGGGGRWVRGVCFGGDFGGVGRGWGMGDFGSVIE